MKDKTKSQLKGGQWPRPVKKSEEIERNLDPGQDELMTIAACPFCGEAGVLESGPCRGSWTVVCRTNTCPASTPGWDCSDPKRAVRLWNARTPARLDPGNDAPTGEPTDPPESVTEFLDGYDGGKFLCQWGGVAKSVHENAVKKGFWEPVNRNPGEVIALIHSELSEALEALRKTPEFTEYKHGPADEHCPDLPNAAVELADAVIRIMDLAQGFGLPVGSAILRKHAYNLGRPYKHGKAF